MNTDHEEFLRALSRLSRRYGIFIGGCGCDGSPYVYGTDSKVIAEDLSWNHKKEKYDCE